MQWYLANHSGKSKHAHLDSLRPSWKVSEDWEGKTKRNKDSSGSVCTPVFLSIKLGVWSNQNEWPFNDRARFLQRHARVYLWANIPLSEGRWVYKLPPQTSRVAVDMPLFSLSFICLCLRPSPFLLYALLTCLALLITKDRYLTDVQLVLLYDPFPSLPWPFLVMAIHHTSSCVRHVLRAGINTLRHYVKKMHARALWEQVHSPPGWCWKWRAIQTRGMSRGTRRSSPADWYLHMELLQSDPWFTAAPWVEGYQMLVVMIMCSAETLSYHQQACNKHLLLACIRTQTDIKTLIAGTLINRNKPREKCCGLAVLLFSFGPVTGCLFFFIWTWHARWGPSRNPLDFFTWIYSIWWWRGEAGSRSTEVCYDCSWGLPVCGKGEISHVSSTHGQRLWTQSLSRLKVKWKTCSFPEMFLFDLLWCLNTN